MRAVTVTAFGGPEAIQIARLPIEQPGAGDVRIKTSAAAVHPVDLATRAGLYPPNLPKGRRFTLGWDLAGVVDAVGSEVTGYAVGDAVVGFSYWSGGFVGTQAEYVNLSASSIALAPAGFPAIEAATLPLNALTADQALDLLDLPNGATLAITGAAGAVGGFAVQLAVARGLTVVGIAGEKDEELVRELGANSFVPRSATQVGKFDGLLDAALVGEPALDLVRDNGTFINVVGSLAPSSKRGIRVGSVEVRSDGANLHKLVSRVESGGLTLRVGDTYPLDEVAAAHERFGRGGVRGRLVLIP
ncbi:MAG TPA: NADPH:quinone reductase [Micromonosporaceae bacterium]|nr:NADPH:quinone reductase [Micromonosporaceae bacterium]HCU48888.1 NADPH:quinone reductase [Micromonosporaceae bacterium]